MQTWYLLCQDPPAVRCTISDRIFGALWLDEPEVAWPALDNSKLGAETQKGKSIVASA